ncbi:hypothetical protein RM549_15700 [Salegentibacter sp. F188]|uniref:Lipoprotein n=1 Tax=Autumnicola patrickiae TaxID=3075591 RepID=A0ABU3E5N4_9FLAO|nr:hypothetical protein [Salegentibacter sp. F188]MDT0691240.1 hypothetical protein [Salegentibacter sp. F188]
MSTLKLLFSSVLLAFILIGCKQSSGNSSEISTSIEKENLASRKEEIKNSIKQMLATYEYRDLAILFGGKVTMNLSTSQVEADDIWEFADEEPQEFINWYDNEILPKSQRLGERSGTSKISQGEIQNDIEPDLEKTITWIGSKISKYSVNNVFEGYESLFLDLSLSPDKLEYTFITRDKEVIGSKSYVTNEETITYVFPLEDIDKIYVKEQWDDWCLLTFESNNKQIQFINRTTGEKNFERERGIQIHCEAEADLEKRLQKAFKHLEKYRANKVREAF